MGRKPWETPVEYNDDRFDDESSGPGYDDSLTDRSLEDFEANDDQFDIDDDDEPTGTLADNDSDEDWDDEFDSLDDEPIDYGQGPHDEEFGEDDDESEG